MNYGFFVDGAGAKGRCPFPLHPKSPTSRASPLRSGLCRLTIPNTYFTITTSASLRSDCCSPSLRNVVRLPSGIDVRLHRNTHKVSQVIGRMPFLWLPLEDEAGPVSRRGYIERNSIALLSNYNRPLIDPPSQDWLGRHCDRERVRNSGLWNSNHVDESHDPAFSVELDRLVSAMGGTS